MDKEIPLVLKPAGAFSRQRRVEEVLCVSVPTLWRMCRDGEFPKPFKLTDKITVWKNDEVNAWFAEQNKKMSLAAVGNPVIKQKIKQELKRQQLEEAQA